MLRGDKVRRCARTSKVVRRVPRCLAIDRVVVVVVSLLLITVSACLTTPLHHHSSLFNPFLAEGSDETKEGYNLGFGTDTDPVGAVSLQRQMAAYGRSDKGKRAEGRAGEERKRDLDCPEVMEWQKQNRRERGS